MVAGLDGPTSEGATQVFSPSIMWLEGREEGVSALYLFHTHDVELALPLGQGYPVGHSHLILSDNDS